MPTRVTYGLAALSAAACIALAGCADTSDPTYGWDEPADYSMTVTYTADDPDAGTFQVIVTDHQVTYFERIDEQGPILEEERMSPQDYSLRQIVGLYRAARADRESNETVTLDSNNIPTEVVIEWHPDNPRDTQQWVISDFSAS